MNWQGWIFMGLAWGAISIIFFYSFSRILFDDRVQPGKQKSHRKKQTGYK